ncbi:LOW QUALITY PROTEIN: conserved Plasmodium protein, unknown function [Plasmodium relictum]|uniref:Uncharacterized protein n=1 Tax=Plasmodium relictum TaxID=85471 RepID=A0A1J1H7P1_PLARL|nr:LOW QUALITY PROTEIN: conserved Plasmodium protein, unknown function [Plasmodium relictum]CRG99439.1 conserved Plasmodium protein, unknown function [Plasmodium relictum]
MISIQTAHSSNQVNFLIKGKFIKNNQNDFLIAAKDTYLELLECDYEGNIYTQNTFLKIIFLQILENKNHDKFIIADEKLNFRILEFDGSFVEYCFIGNLFLDKLKIFQKYLKLDKDDNKRNIEEYNKYINICNIKNLFLISIENFLFFRKIENNIINKSIEDYCLNYKFEKKYISNFRNFKIFYDPLKLKYSIIYNRKGRRKKKNISFSLKEFSVYTYKVKRDNLFSNINNKKLNKNHILINKNKYPIKLKTEIIEKNIKKDNSYLKFCKNINFMIYLSYPYDHIYFNKGSINKKCDNYKECKNGYKKNAKGSIYSNRELKKYTNEYVYGHVNKNFIENINKNDKNNINKITDIYSCLDSYSKESFLQNVKNNIENNKYNYITYSSDKTNTYNIKENFYKNKEDIPKFTTNNTLDNNRNLNKSTLINDNKNKELLHNKKGKSRNKNIHNNNFMSTEMLDINNENILNIEKNKNSYYYNEFENCLNIKICFFIYFLKNKSGYYNFIKNILFLCEKEEKEIINLKDDIIKTIFFKERDLDILKKYNKKLYVNLEKLKCFYIECKSRINDYFSFDKLELLNKDENHNFNTCFICTYYFSKFFFFKRDFTYLNIFQKNFLFNKKFSLNFEQQNNLNLLFQVFIRMKLLLFYFILFFYSNHKTLNNSIIYLYRIKNKHKTLYELSVHIYFLNIFIFHILKFLFHNSYTFSGYSEKNNFNNDFCSHLNNLNSNKNDISDINYINKTNYDINEKFFLINEKLCLLNKKIFNENFSQNNFPDPKGKEGSKWVNNSVLSNDKNNNNNNKISFYKKIQKKNNLSYYHHKLEKIIGNIMNLQCIAIKLLEKMKFDYLNYRKRIYLNKLKKKNVNSNNIVLIISNNNNIGNILFFRQNKKKNILLNNLLIPIAKLTLPLEVYKVERILNNLFFLFTKKVIFLFSFSDIYDINLTLINYYLYYLNDISYIYELKLVKITKEGNTYKEIKSNILFSDYFTKNYNLNHFNNFSNEKWHNFYVKEKMKNQCYLFKKNYFNSYKLFKDIKSIPFIDSFYSHIFNYHYKYKMFEKKYIYADTYSTYNRSNIYYENNNNNNNSSFIIESKIKKGIENKKTKKKEKSVDKNCIKNRNKFKMCDSTSNIENFLLSFEISKKSFNEIYKKKKYLFLDNSCNSKYKKKNKNKEKVIHNTFSLQNDFFSEVKENTNCNIKKKELIFSYLNNENIKRDFNYNFKKEIANGNLRKSERDVEYPLTNVVVPLDKNKKNVHSLSNFFNKRYLLIDKYRKEMYLIIIIYDYYNNKILIYKNDFKFIDNYFVNNDHCSNIVCINNSSLKKKKKKSSNVLLNIFKEKNNCLHNIHKVEEKTNYILVLNKKSSDELFTIKLNIFIQNKHKYLFINHIDHYYSYNKLKAIKDYKYKPKVINNYSNNFISNPFFELQNFQNDSAKQIYQCKFENHNTFDIKKLKTKLLDKLIILDKENYYHKITAGYNIILCKKNINLNNSYNNFFLINFDKEFNILCISNYFQSTYILFLCKNIHDFFEDSISLINYSEKENKINNYEIYINKKINDRKKKNNKSKDKFNERLEKKKNKSIFHVINEEEIKKLNFITSYVLFARSIYKNENVCYVLLLNKTKIILNKYILKSNSIPIKLEDFFELNLCSTILYYHYEKNFLIISYINNLIEIFYVDIINNTLFVLDSFYSSQTVYSIYLYTNNDSLNKNFKSTPYILVCIGLELYCKIIIYYLNFDNLHNTCSSLLLNYNSSNRAIDNNINSYSKEVNNNSYIKGKMRYFVLFKNNLSKKNDNKEKENSIILNDKKELITKIYYYEIDSLNNSIITSVIKLNNFLLVGNNKGVVKAYDMFGENNISDELFLNNFKLYKNQKKIIRVYDEFLLGNNCVYFINPIKINEEMPKEKNIIYKKNCYAIALCENNLFIFLSNKIKKYKNDNYENIEKGYNYINEVKRRVDKYLVDLFNIDEKYYNLIKNKRIGEEKIKNKNIFVLPLMIFKKKKKIRKNLSDNIFIKNEYNNNRYSNTMFNAKKKGKQCIKLQNSDKNSLPLNNNYDLKSKCNIDEINILRDKILVDKNIVHYNDIIEKNYNKYNSECFHSYHNNNSFTSLNNKMLKIKNNINANNVIIIKNYNKKNFVFSIIISINDKLYFGFIQKNILSNHDKNTFKNINIIKFLKLNNILDPFKFYLENSLIYTKKMKNKCNNSSHFSKEEKNENKKKHIECLREKKDENKKRIGIYCNNNNFYFKLDRKIINIYENNNISNVFQINLNRNYILNEFFLINTFAEKQEIITMIEEEIKKNEKKVYLDDFIENFINSNEAIEGDDKSNSFYIFNQLFLRDYNIFSKNKHILYLILNKCRNFDNHFYSFLFYSIINKGYPLIQFFQNNLISNNIVINKNLYNTSYNLKIQENINNILHKDEGTMFKKLSAFIRKKINSNIMSRYFFNFDKTLKDENKLKKRGNDNVEIRKEREQNLKKKKKKEFLDNYYCLEKLKKKKKNNSDYNNNTCLDDRESYRSTRSNDNLTTFNNILKYNKSINFSNIDYVDSYNEKMSQFNNKYLSCNSDESLVELYNKLNKDIDQSNKLYLTNPLNCNKSYRKMCNNNEEKDESYDYISFLIIHLKGSKYHFSNVMEYNKIVNQKIKKSKNNLKKCFFKLYNKEKGTSDLIKYLNNGNKCKKYVKISKKSINKNRNYYQLRKKKNNNVIISKHIFYLLKKKKQYKQNYKYSENSNLKYGDTKSKQPRKLCSYDCLLIYFNNISYCAKKIIICRLKEKINKRLNFSHDDIFFILHLFYNYVFLINYQKKISFWINIKYLHTNIFIIKKIKKNKNNKSEKKSECAKKLVGYSKKINKRIKTNKKERNIEEISKDLYEKNINEMNEKEKILNKNYKNEKQIKEKKRNDILVFKKIKRENILRLFFRNNNSIPLTYLNKNMKNIKPFMNKYIIFTQDNTIILLKIAFSKNNKKIINKQNDIIENFLQSYLYYEKDSYYVIHDHRLLKFSDIFKELIKNQKIIKKKKNENSNINEKEYLENLIKGRIRLRRDNNNEVSSISSSNYSSSLNINNTIESNDRKKNKLEKNYLKCLIIFLMAVFLRKKKIFFIIEFEIIEYCVYKENLEYINDLSIFENKILVTTENYIHLYIYNEHKNCFYLLFSNVFYNINNLTISEKYKKTLVFHSIFNNINVISKKFLSVYHVLCNDLISIGNLKFRNNIKFLFENKLFNNLIGYNFNINKNESIIESLRKYHKFFMNFFLVDKKYNIFNIYSIVLKEKKENYFYDNNRHIEICYDLMLFFQILINGKKNQENILNKTFLYKKKYRDIKKLKAIQKYYFFKQYFMKKRYRLFLNIFLYRIFIYLNKKILFYKKIFNRQLTSEFLFELKLKVFNRLLKLSSYDFSDRRNAFDVLNDIYEQKANKNVQYICLINMIKNYKEIIQSQLYNIHFTNLKENNGLNNNKKCTDVNPITDKSLIYDIKDVENLNNLVKHKYIFKNLTIRNLLEKTIIQKIEKMNKYCINDIKDYKDIIKNSIKDNVYYNIDFYHLIDCSSNKQNSFRKQAQMEYINSLNNNKFDNSLYSIYFNFFIYISNNPKILFHIKKYLHFHTYSTKLLKSKTYYFNLDLLNIIFNFDNQALNELKMILSLFPSSPSIEEVFNSVNLLSMPFCNS